jgi:hypothetical protein
VDFFPLLRLSQLLGVGQLVVGSLAFLRLFLTLELQIRRAPRVAQVSLLWMGLDTNSFESHVSSLTASTRINDPAVNEFDRLFASASHSQLAAALFKPTPLTTKASISTLNSL